MIKPAALLSALAVLSLVSCRDGEEPSPLSPNRISSVRQRQVDLRSGQEFFRIDGYWYNFVLESPESYVSPPGDFAIQWGVPSGSDGSRSALGWVVWDPPHDECPIFEVPFELGRLSYYNGTIVHATGITGADLVMTIDSDNEFCNRRTGVGTMATLSTPNSFLPREDPRNADFVWFRNTRQTPFKKYFEVNEGGAAQATVWGALSQFEGIEPAGLSRSGLAPDAHLVILGFSDVEGDGYLADTVAPIADPGPNQTAECQGPGGTMITLDGSHSIDADGHALTYLWTGPFLEGNGTATGVNPSVTVLPGYSVITLVVNDGSDDSGPVQMLVNVVDTIPPMAVPSGKEIILWPPNQNYHRIDISDCLSRVDDACSGDIDLSSVRVLRVSSDEPEDGGHLGEIGASADIMIECSGSVQLRAERLGNGNGRVYTIVYGFEDALGNQGTAACKVSVPHDKHAVAIEDTGDGYAIENQCEDSMRNPTISDVLTRRTIPGE